MNSLAQYLAAFIWIALLVFVLTRHIKVYRMYDRQLHIVKQIEEEGGLEDGSTLVALNQRVRYIVRICLAVEGIVIGFAGVYGIYEPDFGRSLLFGLAVLFYFYGSEVATGYLTIRDERVVESILEIDDNQRQTDMQANTEAMDRNTAAMTRTSDADDARDIREAITLKENTDATHGNTEAVNRSTGHSEDRTGGGGDGRT